MKQSEIVADTAKKAESIKKTLAEEHGIEVPLTALHAAILKAEGLAFSEMDTPRIVSEAPRRIVIAVDTSASMTGRLLEASKAKVRALVEELGPEECYVVYCDTIVQKVVRYVAGEPVEFDSIPRGRGTDLRAVFEFVKREQINPVCLIYFTDTDVYPNEDPGYPVLWVRPPTAFKPPWGEHVES